MLAHHVRVIPYANVTRVAVTGLESAQILRAIRMNILTIRVYFSP
jgi:hypothetical protein